MDERILIVMLVIAVFLALTIAYCLPKLLERSYNIHDIRLEILDKYPLIYSHLPHYDYMLWTMKPVTVEYWIRWVKERNDIP